MELKSYDKAYLLAFKGAFLMLFGVIGIMQIVGSIKVLYMSFVLLISAIAVLSIVSGFLLKASKTRSWSIFSGIVNLAFSVYLLFQIGSSTPDQLWIIFYWVMFYAVTEIIEAGILIYYKNAFAALLIINASLTLLFGYFLSIVIGNFIPQTVFYIGLVALVIGLTNVLSSYILSKL